MPAVKGVAFTYESDEAVKPLLESFRMMVNHAIWVGRQRRIRSRFKLIKAVYREFKQYGLQSNYTLNACEIASAILKRSKRSHRAPAVRKLFLKLGKQTYRLEDGTLRIPIKPRQFLFLKLKMGQYQRNFLNDPSMERGSITLTEGRVIVTFKKMCSTRSNHESILAYDTNELTLDGALSTGTKVVPIRVVLRNIAKIRADHFKRRRDLQMRLAHCERRLRLKLAQNRCRERSRVNAVLHQVAKEQVNLAKANHSKIILENLKGVKRGVNRRLRKRNRYNGKLQQMSIHSKALKRRLNTWPFRRLHAFVEYKAAWADVPLGYVPAWNTSRTCVMCGCLHTGQRGEQDPKTRMVFECPK